MWLGAAAGLLSLAAPLHFDEAFWVSIASLITEHDRVLYETAIDNKSPLVYLASGVLDWVPGPFVFARSALIGLLAFCLSRALVYLGVTPGARAVAVTTASLAGGLVLTIEMGAVVALGWALVHVHAGRTWQSVGLIGLASLVDPRAALIGLVLIALLIRADARRALVPSAALVGAGVTVLASVLIDDRLRYGLIELNFASRGAVTTPAPLEIVVAMLLVAVPVAFLAVIGGGLSAPGWSIGIAAAIVALASVNPFHHYWIYAVLIVPFIRRMPALDGPRRVLVPATLIPLALSVMVAATVQQDVLADYQAAADTVEESLPQDGVFSQFALTPYVYFFTRSDIGLLAPGIHYLSWDTTRTEAQLGLLAEALERSDVLVDDGGLGIPISDVAVDFRAARAIFDEHRERFDCVTRRGDVTVRSRCA